MDHGVVCGPVWLVHLPDLGHPSCQWDQRMTWRLSCLKERKAKSWCLDVFVGDLLQLLEDLAYQDFDEVQTECYLTFHSLT